MAPLDLKTLTVLSARASVSHTLAEDLRHEFLSKFRRFLRTVLLQNETLGTEGLKALYSEGNREDVIEALNKLIVDFNDSLKDPKALAQIDAEAGEESELTEEEEEAKPPKKKKPSSTVVPVPAPPSVPVSPKDGRPKSSGKAPAAA